MRVLLVQPRHVYAPAPPEHGHIHMPTALLTVATRLLRAGVDVTVADENLAVGDDLWEITGINLVGAPYVPSAIGFARRMRESYPKGKLLLGGQVIVGFTDDEFAGLFGAIALNGNRDRDLAATLGIEECSLPAPESVSLIPAYELLPDEIMSQYVAHEFAFYLSQGCRYTCTFCAAVRSRKDPVTGQVVRVKESYRDREMVDADLRYLVARATRLGFDRLTLYLTNLDLFQSPNKLREFGTVMLGIRNAFPYFRVRMRGLSNVNSFLRVHETEPDLIAMLVSGGLTQVGFGIDGATEKVWKAVGKPHGAYSGVDAVRVCSEIYGIIPEALMVFGHDGVDDDESMTLAVELIRSLRDRYGARPRPHVAKGIVPGNDGWNDPSNRAIVTALRSTPSLFQTLDFTALPSGLTHPDAAFRRSVTRHYLEICELEGTVTQHVLPEEPGLSEDDLARVRSFNQGRYDV